MKSLLILCAFLAATPHPARNVQEIVRSVELRYQHASTLQAVFLERYSDGHEVVRLESGRVYFSRPGRMRWEYESPESKLFLVDGKHVWFYVPADRTASRADIKQSSDWRTPFALLTGKVRLSRLCGRIELASSAAEPATRGGGEIRRGSPRNDQPTQPGNIVLRCSPRQEGREGSADSFEETWLEVDAQNRIVRVVVREPGNIETEFRFGNWQENIPLPEAKFHFEPPPGVAIVNEADLTGTIH